MKNSLLRKTMGIVLALAMTLGIAGCSGKEKPAPPPSEPTAKTEESKPESTAAPAELLGSGEVKYDPGTPVNDGKEITITFWVQTEWQQYYEKWTKEYSEIHPNVKWEISVAGWGDHFTKLPIALSTGTGPDIFHMHNQYSSALVPNMAPYPQDILPHDALRKDFRNLDAHLIKDEIYFLDYGMMTASIYYNKQLWQDAGLTDADIPTTWDQLREVAKRLTQTDAGGKIQVAGFNFNGPIYAEMAEIMLLQKGKYIFTEDGQRNMQEEEYITNLKWLADIYNADKSGSVNFGDGVDSFGNGQSAMIYHWGFVASVMDANFPDLEYGIIPIPSFDGKTPPAYCRNNGESTPGVSKTAKEENKAVAFDFIKYVLANDVYQEQVCSDMILVPAKYNLDSSQKIKDNPATGVMMTYIDRTIWPGSFPATYEGDLVTYISEEILTNGKSVEDAVKAAEPVINKNLKDAGFESVENMYIHASELKY